MYINGVNGINGALGHVNREVSQTNDPLHQILSRGLKTEKLNEVEYESAVKEIENIEKDVRNKLESHEGEGLTSNEVKEYASQFRTTLESKGINLQNSLSPVQKSDVSSVEDTGGEEESRSGASRFPGAMRDIMRELRSQVHEAPSTSFTGLSDVNGGTVA